MRISVKSYIRAPFSNFYAALLRILKPKSPAIDKTAQRVDLSLCRSILVVRPDKIGDAVMTMPFLRELRSNCPSAHIAVVSSTEASPLYETCPYVNEVFAFGVNCGGLSLIAPPMKALRFSKKKLNQRIWDLAVLPRWDDDNGQAHFVAWASTARRVVGYSEKVHAQKALDNRGYDLLLTDIYSEDCAERHEVKKSLELLLFLGARVLREDLELWTSAEDESVLRQIYAKHGLPFAGSIVICPGASEAKKKWPKENFLEVMEWLFQISPSRPIVIIGGKADQATAQWLQHRFSGRCLNLAGEISLRQTLACLKSAAFYVGNDTGPAHMAAAAGIPVIQILCHAKSSAAASVYSPERIGVWTPLRSILQPEFPLGNCREECRDDKPHCIQQVSMAQVKTAIQKVL